MKTDLNEIVEIAKDKLEEIQIKGDFKYHLDIGIENRKQFLMSVITLTQVLSDIIEDLRNVRDHTADLNFETDKYTLVDDF